MDSRSRFEPAPTAPLVDVTVRGIDDIAAIVSHAREAAAALRRRTGHAGPFVVTVEGVGDRGWFVTVRAGRSTHAPEVGCIERAAPGALDRAFALLARHLDALSAA